MLQAPVSDRQNKAGSAPTPRSAGAVTLHPRVPATRGNQATLRLLSSRSGTGAVLQRKCACGGSGEGCADCQEKQETVVHRLAGSQAEPNGVPPIVDEVLRSPGQPLDATTRAFMEPRFGQDFSGVRLHMDSRAAESARAVNALAYTVGRDIVIGTDAYAPHTSSGQRLIAHELTHVVQQSGSLASSSFHASRVSSAADPWEQEAERAADSLTVFTPAQAGQTGDTLQRYSHVDCTDAFLRAHVWPADYIARQMLAKAIRVLGASPSDPTVTSLLNDYFKSPTASVTTILGIFNRLQTAFTDSDYTYECEDDCDAASDGDAYTRMYMPWGRIHLCENLLSSQTNNYIAEVILHEFTHKYSHTDDNLYCNAGCTAGDECCPCGAGLSASAALDNADSYACFADRLYGVTI